MKTLFGNELLNQFKELLKSAEKRIWICSPYVGSLDYIKLISNNKFVNPSIEKRFITDINELSGTNFSLFQEVVQNGELRTLTGVHAKIYIIDDKCLVSSANLTETAFERRYEIGVFLDSFEAKKTIDIYELFWDKSTRIESIEKPLSNANSWETYEGSGFFLPKIWGSEESKMKPTTRKYWLKPIGVTENPVAEDRSFSNLEDELHFSVKPKSVSVGDYLIAYGIGAKRILTLYEVTSNWGEFDSPDEDWQFRWKYFLKGKNLTTEFGATWMHHNLYASKLVSDFLSENPNRFVTANKGKTLGALSYKKDKIGLSPEFAEFIIRRMKL